MAGVRPDRKNELRDIASIPELDRIDTEILRHLQNNARLSVKEIAAEVSLAASTTHEHIRRMREGGILRGTHVEVDPKALGIGLEALFMIELSKHERGTVDQFTNRPGVTRIETSIVFEARKRYELPVFRESK